MIIPKRWDEVLQRLHANGFPEAVIAGGALRDLDNGKPIKDVDVWVAGKGGSENEQAMLAEAFGYKGESIFDMPEPRLKEEYPDWNEGVCGVTNFSYRSPRNVIDTQMYPKDAMHGVHDLADYGCDMPPEFQVIVLGDMASRVAAAKGPDAFGRHVVSGFDIGLCQIWYWDGEIPLFTLAYGKDYMFKDLTVVRAPNEAQLERTKKRLDRLRIKYPDYTPQNVHVQPEAT